MELLTLVVVVVGQGQGDMRMAGAVVVELSRLGIWEHKLLLAELGQV